MYDRKLLESLPQISRYISFKEKHPEESIPEEIEEMLEYLKDKTYEDIFLSFEDYHIRIVKILKGKPVYDPIYTQIYLEEKHSKNLKGFDNCYRIQCKNNFDEIKYSIKSEKKPNEKFYINGRIYEDGELISESDNVKKYDITTELDNRRLRSTKPPNNPEPCPHCKNKKQYCYCLSNIYKHSLNKKYCHFITIEDTNVYQCKNKLHKKEEDNEEREEIEEIEESKEKKSNFCRHHQMNKLQVEFSDLEVDYFHLFIHDEDYKSNLIKKLNNETKRRVKLIENQKTEQMLYQGKTLNDFYFEFDSLRKYIISMNMSNDEEIYFRNSIIGNFDNNETPLYKYNMFLTSFKPSFTDNRKDVHNSGINTCININTNIFSVSFKFLDPFFFKYICLAGGSVVSTLLSHSFFDYDIFFHSCSDKVAKYIIDSFIKRAGSTVSFCKYSKDSVTIKLIYDNRTIETVQFILRIHRCPSDIIHGFDIDSTCILYDFLTNSFYMTKRFIYSLENRMNTVNFEKLSPTYEYRLSKYLHKGFDIFVPLVKEKLLSQGLGNFSNNSCLNKLISHIYEYKEFHRTTRMKSQYENGFLMDYEAFDSDISLTFKTSNPGEQSIGTFHKTTLESVNNWYNNSKIECSEEQEEQEDKIVSVKNPIKYEDYSEINKRVVDSLPNGIQLIGGIAYNLFTNKNCNKALNFIYASPSNILEREEIINKFITNFISNVYKETLEMFINSGVISKNVLLEFKIKPEKFTFNGNNIFEYVQHTFTDYFDDEDLEDTKSIFINKNIPYLEDIYHNYFGDCDLKEKYFNYAKDLKLIYKIEDKFNQTKFPIFILMVLNNLDINDTLNILSIHQDQDNKNNFIEKKTNLEIIMNKNMDIFEKLIKDKSDYEKTMLDKNIEVFNHQKIICEKINGELIFYFKESNRENIEQGKHSSSKLNTLVLKSFVNTRINFDACLDESFQKLLIEELLN